MFTNDTDWVCTNPYSLSEANGPEAVEIGQTFQITIFHLFKNNFQSNKKLEIQKC